MTYSIRVEIGEGRVEEHGLTWRQACLALQAYGARVKGPITAAIEPHPAPMRRRNMED